MSKLVNESLNEKYSLKPKGFFQALHDLNNSLSYLYETEDENLWFLKENPDIKEIIDKMVNLNDELGNHLHNIDWGQTDWLNLKKWKWDTPGSYNDKAPGSASNRAGSQLGRRK